MSDEQSDLLFAAVQWWQWRRPTGWTLEQHLENPTINIDTDSPDARLAIAVANLLKQP